MIIITSERLLVRRYRLEDEEAFFRINSDAEVMRYIRPPKNPEESKIFLLENIAYYDEHPGLGRWMIQEKDTGHIVGMFSLLPLEHTSDVHIGYAFMKDQWGKGYATEIARAGIIYAFNVLNLSTLTAVTYVENIPSQKVLLRNGFRPDGTYHEHGLDNLLFRLNRD
ncbi:MAG TPA: GNAT family N-acetyltransferase [Chitinophagaceae bacterium]|nr:GNAT family N-acetyltransferase [Chitinophagaceae bacterium]